jgi:hypothetical protein
MFFQRILRDDPEKVFITVKNSYSTAAITVGQAVAWDYTTDADGVGVTQPTTALFKMPAGIVESASIAAGDYGLVQVYGHNANALVNGSSGTVAGMALRVENAAFSLLRISTAIDTFGEACSFPFICGQAFSTGAAAAKKVFIRCL